jgi:hypothetical protein
MDVLAQAPFYKYFFLSTTSTSDFFPPEFCPFSNNKVGVFFSKILDLKKKSTVSLTKFSKFLQKILPNF